MYCAYYIFSNLLPFSVQENLTMVLEVVYFVAKIKVAQSMSKQIWNILYKDTVSPKVLQLEGGEEETMESEDNSDDKDTKSEGMNTMNLPLELPQLDLHPSSISD